jgi:ABC-type lipoprotein release transport system permease subunit
MKLYLRLAWRNLWRHRRRTLVVVFSIAMGLSLMMFYDGFVAGFEDAIYANAVKVLGGNIQVHAEGYSEKMDQTPLLPLQNDRAVVDAALTHAEVVTASRRINTGGMATSREGAFPVNIVGIEPEQEAVVNLAAQNIIAGRYLTADDLDVVFIGKGLAEAMNLTVGDRFALTGRGTHNQMRNRTMTVAGVYDLGLTDIEKRTVYVSLKEAQDLYGLTGKSTEVAISLKQLGTERPIIQSLKSGLNGYEIASWETNFPEMREAISTKGGVMNVFSVIILMIAGIGIMNLLLMVVYERTREIGLMGALGMKPRQIMGLFVLEGAMMGLVGLVFGIGLGLLLNITIGQVGFDYSQFASMTEYTALINDRIYPTLGVDNLFQRSLTVMIIAILAALYPAREAAKSEPAAALHYV